MHSYADERDAMPSQAKIATMLLARGVKRPGRQLIVFLDSSLTGYDCTGPFESYVDAGGSGSRWRTTEYPGGVTFFHLWGKGLPEFARPVL